MDYEDFNNLASGIQALVVAVGVLVGGVWAMYRFWTLRSIEKARADLDKIKRELTNRGTLEIQIEPSYLKASGNSGNYIQVLVKIKNVGTGTEVIRWQGSTIQAARLTQTTDGPTLGDPITGIQLRAEAIVVIFTVVNPQQVVQTSFIVPITSNGTYLIDAQLLGSPSETAAAITDARLAGVAAEAVFWGGAVFFEITQVPP